MDPHGKRPADLLAPYGQHSSRMRTQVLVGAVIFAVALGTILGMVLVMIAEEASTRYGVVLDCDYEGTRAHVYSWPHGAYADQSTLPSVKELTQGNSVCQVAGGLYKLNATGGVDQYLAPLLDCINQLVPEGDRAGSSLYVKGAGGVQPLAQNDQTVLLQNVAGVLSQSGYNTSDNHVAVLSGQDQAVFDWIAINFAKNTLGSLNTYGAIDMGQSDLNIAFQPNSDITNHTVFLEIFNAEYYLYAWSYEGYGLISGEQLLFEYLSNNTQEGQNVSVPCLPVGYTSTALLPQGPVTVTGYGDSTDCYHAAESMMGKNLCSMVQSIDCGIMGEYQPALNGDFVAFRGYGYTSSYFSMPPNATANDFMAEAEKVCGLSWATITSTYPLDAQGQFNRQDLCFDLWYQYTVLTLGFGFNANATSAVMFDKEVPSPFDGNTEPIPLTYALGALVYDEWGPAGNRRSDVVVKRPLMTLWWGELLLVVGCVGAVAGLGVVVHALVNERKEHYRHSSYTVIS